MANSGPLKKCNGCKHLVALQMACKADEDIIRIQDPYTDRVYYRNSKRPLDFMRPAPSEMRQPGGPCGPDRKLFEPTLLARLFPFLYD
jgi:hypothetical protein